MGRTVQHIALNCRDRLAQEEFYSDHFGFRRARVFEAGTPGEFVMLRLGDTCMELFQAGDPAGKSGGEQPVGFKHMCFEVPDLQAKVDELAAAGFEMGPVIDCSHQSPGLAVCFFKDPEGNVLELMQGWQDDPDVPSGG
jgi:glyoxylase I family protein